MRNNGKLSIIIAKNPIGFCQMLSSQSHLCRYYSQSIHLLGKFGNRCYNSNIYKVFRRFFLGGMYIIEKEWHKAKEQLVIANQICNCYPHAANNLGLVYQNENQLKLAEDWFKKAITIDPNYQLGYKNLGILYFNQGKYQEAESQFEKILTDNKNNPEVLYWLQTTKQRIKQGRLVAYLR